MPPIQSYTLPPDKLTLAVHYALARHALYFAAVGFSALVLFLLIWWRVAPRLRGRPLPAVIAIIYAITTLLDLPAAICAHMMSLHYGISIETWRDWFSDWGKAEGVALVITVLAVWGFYMLLRRSPERWWIYAWLCSVPLVVFGAWIEPYALEPMFNQFVPLATTHPELVGPIETLLHKARVSIPSDHLFEMRASAKTHALNAYVSGFGSSKRVVLYDTIIQAEPEPSLMTTFGHELGHYVLGHIVKGIGYGAVLLLIAYWIAFQMIHAFISRWGEWFDVRDPADPGSITVFALMLLILSFLGDPIGNFYSRAQEHQADVYSLQITDGIIPDNGQAAARAFQIEGENALEPPDPNPFIVFWLYTHPPVSDRLKFSVDWHKGSGS